MKSVPGPKIKIRTRHFGHTAVRNIVVVLSNSDANVDGRLQQ